LSCLQCTKSAFSLRHAVQFTQVSPVHSSSNSFHPARIGA
jgi:hypothetical protein